MSKNAERPPAEQAPQVEPPAGEPASLEVGLVLGGGGARGYAHIGVLKALAERGIAPVAIAGCSAGAIAGAFVGAGVAPDEMVALLQRQSFTGFLDVGALGGIIGGGKLGEFLTEHLPETFEELNVPLNVTAVDLQRGRLDVLRNGDLVTALRASSALPGILSPVAYRDSFYLDGGLLNNLPVDLARAMTLQPVIAVDVGAPPDRELVLDDSRSFWQKMMRPFVEGQRLLTLELFLKSFDIPAAFVTEMRLAVHPPDLLIRPPLPKDFKLEDFGRLEEGVEIGYTAALEALDGWELLHE